MIREQLVQDSQKVMPESVPPSLESLEAKSGSTFEDKTCGEWMVVSRRKGRARHGNPSHWRKVLAEMSHLKEKLVRLRLMPKLAVEWVKEKS